MFRNQSTRPAGEFNAASMADIAFLLVLFFLMTSTILDKKGLFVGLPEEDADTSAHVAVEARNVFNISLDSGDVLRIQDTIAHIASVQQRLISFVLNSEGQLMYASAPDKAVVNFRFHPNVSFQSYLEVLDHIKMASKKCREEYARKLYNRPLDSLPYSQQQQVISELPLPIYESDFEQ